MPAFKDFLGEEKIHLLAAYVYSLSAAEQIGRRTGAERQCRSTGFVDRGSARFRSRARLALREACVRRSALSGPRKDIEHSAPEGRSLRRRGGHRRSRALRSPQEDLSARGARLFSRRGASRSSSSPRSIFYGAAVARSGMDGRRVLFDLAARKFYIFGLVFWPQDFIFLTGLLIISALSLFLFTAVAGRLVVRLRLSADGVYRNLHVDRAQDRGRPPGAHEARPASLGRRASSASRRQSTGRGSRCAVDWYHLRRLFHADPTLLGELATFSARAVGDVLGVVLRLCDLRQCRLDARAGVQVHVPLRALPGGDVRFRHAHHHLR